jgi:hypothetical protein
MPTSSEKSASGGYASAAHSQPAARDGSRLPRCGSEPLQVERPEILWVTWVCGCSQLVPKAGVGEEVDCCSVTAAGLLDGWYKPSRVLKL